MNIKDMREATTRIVPFVVITNGEVVSEENLPKFVAREKFNDKLKEVKDLQNFDAESQTVANSSIVSLELITPFCAQIVQHSGDVTLWYYA